MIIKNIKLLIDKWSSFLYAGILIALPWESIRGNEFADIRNYTSRIETIQKYGGDYYFWEWSLTGLLRFEFLWFKIISFAAEQNIEAIVFLKSITAISSFINHNYLKKFIGAWWSFVVLLNPITIDLLSSQVRSALAFSIFLLIIDNNKEKIVKNFKLTLLLTLPFVHTAMIYVLVIYFISNIFSKLKLFSNEVKSIAVILLSMASIMLVTVIGSVFIEAIDDRRNLSNFAVKSFSYVVFWIFYGLFLAINKSNLSHSRWEYYFAIIICLSCATMDIFGIPGFRFIALSIPIIFSIFPLAANDMKKILFVATMIYGFLLFLYWIL